MTMNTSLHAAKRAPFLVGLGTIAVAVTVYACSGADRGKPMPLTEPNVPNALAASSGEAATGPRSRVKAAEKKYKWVGELHSAAMADLRNNRAAYEGAAGGGAGAGCRVGRALARKHATAYAAAKGKSRTAADNAELDKMLVLVKACETASEGSVFARVALPRTPDLSGNLSYYEDAIWGAIESWNGVSDLYVDVWDAMDNVGWQMPLTQDDTDVIGMMVDLTVASHGDAMEVEWPNPETEVSWDASIFRRHEMRRWPKWLRSVVKVIKEDVIGAAVAVVALITTDPEGDRGEQFEDALFAGIGASGTATVNCINGYPPCSE